jgi:nitroreductase
MSTIAAASADPWSVREEDLAAAETTRDKMAVLVRYALLAPSTKNTQPWRFRVGDDAVFLHADRSRRQPVADGDLRELYLSLGCALENLLIAAERFGYVHVVEYFPDPFDADLVASVVFTRGGGVDPVREGLFAAIPSRATCQRAFRAGEVDDTALAALEAATHEPGVAVHLTSDAGIRERAEALCLEADARLFSDPAFRQELARWIGEGVFGTSWFVSKLGELAVPLFNLTSSEQKKDRARLASAPVLGLISAEANDRLSQVRAGQAFERLWLRATALGLALQPMSQIVQLADLKAQVSQLLPDPARYPMQPFRLGFGDTDAKRTPRRPLAEVLLG